MCLRFIGQSLPPLLPPEQKGGTNRNRKVAIPDRQKGQNPGHKDTAYRPKTKGEGKKQTIQKTTRRWGGVIKGLQREKWKKMGMVKEDRVRER